MVPSPLIEMMLIVDSVHVLQAGWHRVGQVDSETSPPREHTDGLQRKSTLTRLLIYPKSNRANSFLLKVFLAGGREEIYL